MKNSMDSEKVSLYKQFIEEISTSITHIIWKNFPEIPIQEKDDIAQEIRLKIWKMISKGRKIRNFKSYIGRVVYTTTLDMISKKIDSIPIEQTDESKMTFPASTIEVLSPEKSLEKKENQKTVREAVNSLPQSRRIVMKLHLNGMNTHEIADFLCWTQSKVNHLFHRGKNDIGKKLKSKVVTKLENPMTSTED